MNLTKLRCFTLMIAATFTAQAQKTLDKLPENPQPGKCYVKCVTPNVFETIEKKIIVTPAYKKLTIVPATYKTTTYKIVERPAYKKFVLIPAVFKTEYEQVKTQETYKKITIIPATFLASNEKIEKTPLTGAWQYGDKAPGCTSQDPFACRTICWKETPATYKTIETQKLDKDATTKSDVAGGKHQNIKKQTLVKDGYVKEIIVPAVYKEYTRKELVKDEYVKEETIAAVYKTIQTQVLVEKGGLSVWEEVDCSLTQNNILPIYYELGSSSLSDSAKKMLDKTLLKLLVDQPNLRVLISSYTDSRGTKERNMDLSLTRAQAVVKYLVSKGIPKTRMIPHGYGETRSKNTNPLTTEKEHQLNRKTEFRVISY